MKTINLPRGDEWKENSYLVVGYGISWEEAEDIVNRLASLAEGEPGRLSVTTPQNPNCVLKFIRV